MNPGDEGYDAAVRRTAAALPPLTPEARDRLTLLLRGTRPAEAADGTRKAS